MRPSSCDAVSGCTGLYRNVAKARGGRRLGFRISHSHCMPHKRSSGCALGRSRSGPAHWKVLARRMKGARDHRVPLSERAHEILAAMHAARTSEFVFPGSKAGRPLSNMALRMLLGRTKIEGATVHGFRSSFRDWAGDATPFPRELPVGGARARRWRSDGTR